MISSQSPVPIKSPLFGPAYISQSGKLADQQCINLYPEIVETKTGEEIGALYNTPGLILKATLPPGPIRAMHVAGLSIGPITGSEVFQQLFVVSGNNLYSLDLSLNSTLLGSSIGTLPAGYLYSLQDIQPGFSNITLPFVPFNYGSFVTMADNGFDLAIFVGMSVVQQDGFGLVNQPGTYTFWQSNEVDFSNWDPLNFAQASGDPDYIVALAQIRREIFIIKQNHTEVWNNAGTPDFTFAREQGPYLQAGTNALASVAKLGETLFWLAQNSEGNCIVVKLVGYNLQRISTHFIEREIQTWPSQGFGATGYAYQQRGHTFYALNSTAGDQTWVYDDTTSGLTGIPMWHQRKAYNNTPGGPTRHWADNAVSFGGFNLVGDYRNGNIYAYDLDTYTDNNNPKVWLRSYRAIPQRSGKILKFNSVTFDMETGLGVTPPDANPQVQFRWSDDGGSNWSPLLTQSAGKTGATAQRVKFNRLGALRASQGYDRIFEISSSDQFAAGIIGSLVDTSQ